METTKQRENAEYLSIVLSGGISLGAYHAGVVAQLGWFLEAWQRAKAADPTLPNVFVDMVSGASAGALTGAMLFQYIGSDYYASNEGPTAFLKASYNAWCKELSLPNLLGRATKDKEQSVLSSKVIEELAAKSIGDLEPALPSGQERLFFTCTMTSLQPITFNIDLPDARSNSANVNTAGATRRDWMTYQITTKERVPDRMRLGEGAFKNLAYAKGSFVFMELGSTPSIDATENVKQCLWNRLRFAAMASGAFPFAWSPVIMTRNLRFYPQPFKGGAGDTSETVFHYMDGGVLDNMPLGRAAKVIRDYALWTDSAAGITSRTYVLIDVNPVQVCTPAQVVVGECELKHDTTLNIWKEAGPLVEAMREQGYYRDLRGAQQTNLRLTQREKLFWPLLKELAKSRSSEETEQRITEVDADLANLLKDRYHPDTPEEEVRLREMFIEQYEERYEEFFRDIEGRQKQLLLRTIIAADMISELGGKHHFSVLRIQPSKTLKSAFFGNFGGFVDPGFMRDDFWHGMQCAKQALRDWLSRVAPNGVSEDLFCSFEEFVEAAGDANVAQQAIEAYYADNSLPSNDWSLAPRESQSAFLKAIAGRSNAITGHVSGALQGWGKFLASGWSVLLLLALLLCCWPASALALPWGTILVALLGMFAGVLGLLMVVSWQVVPKIAKLVPKVRKPVR
jgi:hypothetical protein